MHHQIFGCFTRTIMRYEAVDRRVLLPFPRAAV